MLSELYSLVLWTVGGFAAFLYGVESLGLYSQGLGFLDPVLVAVGFYSAYRLGKGSALSFGRRVAAAAPVVLLVKHLFDILPPNPIIAGVSILVTVAVAVGVFQVLGAMKAKKAEPKAKPAELGDYPLLLDEKEGHYITTKQITEHIQVIGKSGSGKSASYFWNAKYQVLKQGKGCFSFDAKSEELPLMTFYAHEAGRMADFIPFDLRFPERSLRVNPLAWFKKDNAGNTVPDADVISQVVRQSVYFMNESKDDYYPTTGKEFLRNATGLLTMEVPIVTYNDFYQLVATEIESFETIAYLCNKYPGTSPSDYFKNHWLNMSNTERRKVLSGLLNLLAPFTSGPWAPLINTTKPDFLISEIVQKNKIFHFGAASLVYPSDYRKISASFLIGLMSEVGRRAEHPQRIPFDIFLDEFASIAYPGFEDIVEKVRSSDIGIHLGHQSLGDLMRAGGHAFQEAILDSTTTKIFFRLLSDETADRCSKILGTQAVDPYMVRSVKTNAGPFGGVQEAGATIKERDKEFIVPPDTFKNLNKGEGIVMLTYSTGVTRFKMQFPMAPTAPASFDFKEVLGLRNHHLGAIETSLPLKKAGAVAKVATAAPVEGNKPAFMKDPVFLKEEAKRKEKAEKKGKGPEA